MKILSTLAVAATLSVSCLSAYTITTGGKTGTYNKVGHNLSNLVSGGEVINSKGSIENLERLMSGEADVGVVQLDAYAYYASKHPDVSSKLEIMGSLYKECVHIAVNKDGKVKNEDDLQKEGVTIAIGKQGSGTAVTWDYMMKLEPGYKKASVSFTGGSRAFGKLSLSSEKGDSVIDAVMWVTKPNLNDKYLQIVMNNPQLKMIAVNDKDLNDKYKPIGRPVYEFDKLPTKDGLFSSGALKTPCVDAVLVARSDSDEALLENIADVMLSYKSSLLK